MKLLFVHSHVFKYDKDNNFYSDGKLTYKMWEDRYLPQFKTLKVAARGSAKGDEELNLSSGPNVEHVILPNISSIKERNKKVGVLKNELEALIIESDALIARLPSEHAFYAIKIAKELNKPYVVEVVGDIFSSYWNHGSIYGKILAPLFFLKYRKIIRESPYLIYVTKDFLQEKYPHNANAYTISASNVEIPAVPEEVLKRKLNQIKSINPKSKVIKIGLIGSYSSKYKGIDTAIKAVKTLNERGFNCNLVIVGDGNNRSLKELSIKLGIEDKIIFAGTLPGGVEVFKWLDTLDIYIQPSLTEGLPRALIEAMSRGIPCIGSSVGGIPELIDQQFIHIPKSEKGLSDKIATLLSNTEEMSNQAKKNFQHAKNYTSDVLNLRRQDFWMNFITKELKKNS